MRNVIIGDSLTEDFFGPDYGHVKVNIGIREIDRLMGAAEDYGNGPLPTYMTAAQQAAKSGQSEVHTILLRDLHDPEDPSQQAELMRYGYHNIQDTPGADFIAPIKPLVKSSRVIDTQTLALPMKPFHDEMSALLGKSLFELTQAEREQINFVLTGGFTDIRIIDTARKIRNDYEFPNVYVCPHLVGSSNYDGHVQALKTGLPDALVTVVPSLEQIAVLSGVRQAVINTEIYSSCDIKPIEVAENLSAAEKAILERLFLFVDSVDLKSLTGGWSGSKLFLAQGTKQGAQTDSEIIKIDRHDQMHRELRGYHLVRDYLGKHVPNFSAPVTEGDSTGIKMDLAAMQGQPQTLQDQFESIEDTAALDDFIKNLETAIQVLSSRLYQNTKKQSSISPKQSLGLNQPNVPDQLATRINQVVGAEVSDQDTITVAPGVTVPSPLDFYNQLHHGDDTTQTEVCLVHRDLNTANIIADQAHNTWVIDWVYAGEYLIETDLARLESELKLVVSKNFSESDLPDLHQFERFVVDQFELPPLESLPEALEFIRTDLRYQKIYRGIRLIRAEFAKLKDQVDFDLYKTVLLRYAGDTMGYDARTGSGECDLTQLKYALISTALIANSLTTQKS